MLIETLKEIVGPKGWIADDTALEDNLTEWRRAVRGRTPIMVSPASTEQVSQVVKACASAGVAIVPQGGNTGMCAGAIPDESGDQILLNLARMNSVRAIDPLNFSITVDAGCILANIQEAARAKERYFPLRLGAEGSCQIGGNLSTNAGGLNVIRYGTARNLVLGLEVVLADGRIWDGLRSLRKDTAGYDLKQLFVGSEGTLGIITGASLRLFPEPGDTSTALIAIPSAGAAVPLLSEIRKSLSDRIEAFELIGANAFDLVEKNIPDARVPFDRGYPWYVLLDVSVGGNHEDLEAALGLCMENQLILDAIICKSAVEAQGFWHLRHSISAAERLEGAGIKHDISVPISQMETFLVRCEQALKEQFPAAKLIVFGHVGDGNLHYNVHVHEANNQNSDDTVREQISTCIYDLVVELGGSFSAEHGVGLLKRKYLERYKSEVDLSLMRAVKGALDPERILNPGKVI